MPPKALDPRELLLPRDPYDEEPRLLELLRVLELRPLELRLVLPTEERDEELAPLRPRLLALVPLPRKLEELPPKALPELERPRKESRAAFRLVAARSNFCDDALSR